jgi:hypothetical protein
LGLYKKEKEKKVLVKNNINLKGTKRILGTLLVVIILLNLLCYNEEAHASFTTKTKKL